MKKAIIYIRVSSVDQNPARQLEALKNATSFAGYEVEEIIDKASGSIPFHKRKANHVLTDNDIKLLVVHDIDRLGRDAIDVMTTIKALTEKGTNVFIYKLGQSTILPDGSKNPILPLIVNMLATLGEMEREKIRDRQAEGIKAAKKRGTWKGRGKQKKAKANILKKHSDIVELLNAGLSIRKAAKHTSKSAATVQKVKQEMNKPAKEVFI